MKYCEFCHILSNEENRCEHCGKPLRTVKDEDFCFVQEIDRSQQNNFQMLIGEHIPCAFLPSGNGVRTKFALPLENLKAYVPFAFYDEVLSCLNGDYDDTQNNLKEDLLQHIDQLFIRDEEKEKICKSLRVGQSQNVLAVIAEIIQGCDIIVDNGIMPTCPKNGHAVLVYAEDGIITVNSATYEIVSVE